VNTCIENADNCLTGIKNNGYVYRFVITTARFAHIISNILSFFLRVLIIYNELRSIDNLLPCNFRRETYLLYYAYHMRLKPSFRIGDYFYDITVGKIVVFWLQSLLAAVATTTPIRPLL